MSRSDKDLEKRLRQARPKPRDEFTSEIVRRMTADRPRRSSARRLAPALGLTALLVVAMASVGGMAQARSAVVGTTSAAINKIDRLVTGPSPRKTASRAALSGAPQTGSNTSRPATSNFASISNFTASHAVYPKPILVCRITASNRRMRVSGLTTVKQGTISVTITKIAGGPDPSFPWTAPTLAVTSFVWGPTAQSPQGKRGRTYKATATQTAAGYQPGKTTCRIRFHDDDDGWDDD